MTSLHGLSVSQGEASKLRSTFLVSAVSSRAGSIIAEQIRDKGAEVVLSAFRLVKVAMVHSMDNQAVEQTVEATGATLRSFGAAIGGTVSITFVDDTVFVCGELLRASRGMYESAIELGKLLARGGVSELSFAVDVGADGLKAFAGALAHAVRDPSRRTTLLGTKFPGVIVRKTDPILDRSDDEMYKKPAEKVVRLYASALAVMRRFFDAVAVGSTMLPLRVKRLAQSISTISEAGRPAMVGMLTLANAHRDDAGRAVQAALLAVVITRQITNDRVQLSRMAMAALLADAGRVRLAGITGRDRLVPLADDIDMEVPAATSTAGIATAGVNMASAERAVLMHEATWIERSDVLGRPYGGTLPTLVQTQILHVVRALLDRVAPRDASRPKSPLDAMAEVAKLLTVDPAVMRLAVRALGVIPTGTVVELDSGEWAVVVGRSADADALDRPRVRVVTDPSGRALEPAIERDLGVTRDAKGARIVRILDAAASRFNVMRAFLAY